MWYTHIPIPQRQGEKVVKGLAGLSNSFYLHWLHDLYFVVVSLECLTALGHPDAVARNWMDRNRKTELASCIVTDIPISPAERAACSPGERVAWPHVPPVFKLASELTGGQEAALCQLNRDQGVAASAVDLVKPICGASMVCQGIVSELGAGEGTVGKGWEDSQGWESLLELSVHIKCCWWSWASLPSLGPWQPSPGSLGLL